MRKLLITVIAFAAVGLGFWAVVSVMDSTPIVTPRADSVRDVAVPVASGTAQKIGDTTPEVVEQMRYFKYDPITQAPVAEYGFARMLNPGQGRTRWEVEKPYIVFYRPKYQYRIDADRGIFQVESGGSSAIPKDAQLDENVIIHIQPRPGGPLGETFIYMDDLIFSSERSEFTTDGPVRVDSAQVQMDGFGLIFIFNTAIGKIEYLHLRDLEYLRLKRAAATVPDPPRPAAAPTQQTPQTAAVTAAVENEASLPVEPASPTLKSGRDYYLCTIDDNVEIQYGHELIVSGADQVNIENIDFAGLDDRADRPASATSPAVADRSAVRVSDPSAAGSSDRRIDLDPAPADDAGREVLVKCDGGIIIKPMPTHSAAAGDSDRAELALEMSGTPLRIERRVPMTVRDFEPLAHCGLLTYRPAEDVLRLFTSPLTPEILLNAAASNSHIRTRGNVFWDRPAGRANVHGPGQVTIGSTLGAAAAPIEINFQGVMDLMFAQLPEDMSAPAIQMINLTGGMDAVLRQNGTFETRSDAAVLEFGPTQTISQATLTGDVHLASLDPANPSQAASDSAVFRFADNQIAQADLAGDVRFASTDGQFESASAVIEFHPDADGSMHPAVVRTDGQATMQTVSSTEQPPARFEAQKIDYDLVTGSGLAHGPVRLTYYEAARDADCLDAWVPMTITADQDTRFIADADRTIRQVTLRDNVVASRLMHTALYTQRDQIHGDKLVVRFDKDAAGKAVINGVTVSEGDVFVQSVKVRDNETLFNVKLDCRQIDYRSDEAMILAAGPGKIEVDNSGAEATASTAGQSNLKRPCVARVKGFDTLRWNLASQKLIADGQEETMMIEYYPLVNRVVDGMLTAASRRFEMDFVTDAAGATELSRVFTDQGIYVEQTPGHVLVGRTMEYNALESEGWLTITGTPEVPCFIDKVRVPSIRYNVHTGQLDKTSISTMPGIYAN